MLTIQPPVAPVSHTVYPHRESDLADARVLIVSDAAPHRNGVGAYYQDLVQHLKPHVAAVKVISPSIIGGQWQGGWMLPLPGDSTQKVCFPNARLLKKRIERFAPTVVVTPTPGPFGVMGARYARQHGAKLIAGFHTWYEKLCELYGSRLNGKLTRGYFQVSNRLLFYKCDEVLANSREMVDIAKTLGAKSAGLMGTPVSQPFLETPLAALPNKAGSFLFAGRLAAEKNLPALLAAAKSLPQIQFSIAGDGPLRKMVEVAARTHANVRYLGWLKRDQLIEQMDAHDGLILPSQVESFGTIALEAMARQRLVVVSAACGITDWSALREGLIVIPEPSDMVSTLHNLYQQDGFTLAAQARRARTAVVEHNQWNTQLWLDLIRQSVH